MKPRTLASIGAVVLYLYCELSQASPFAFAESVERAQQPTERIPVMHSSRDSGNDLQALFGPAELRGQ